MTYQEKLDSYDEERLKKLADSELIHPKGYKYYAELLQTFCDENKIIDEDVKMEIESWELWSDCCEVINHLAQLVLDEREKRSKFITDLKQELQSTIDNLENNFDD